MRPHTSSDEAHRIAFGFSPPDDRYFATRLRDGLGERGRTPRRSGTERQQRAGQAAEEVGFGTCRGEGEAHAARGLDDTGGDFQEPKTQRREAELRLEGPGRLRAKTLTLQPEKLMQINVIRHYVHYPT